MSNTVNSHAQRMTLLWFTVLSAPLMIGIAISLLVWFGNFKAPAELLPADTLRMVAMGAMGLMLVIARPLRNLVLSPSAIAGRPLQSHTVSEDMDQQAAAKTQASMFMLLGALDFVSVIIIALSLMQADAELALLNGIFTLVLAVVAKPDFAMLITDTAKQLRQTT
ncbi:hypothetical protein [Alcanivorax sp. DP30]|uniref:hypothetical protein n=1 Tax=Alcanivorax sp. DP30 TaxID=2606217 RepID=UPI001F36BD77|nr:hypothetical protein [Alcanivorax sp. DP30]